MRIDGTQQKPSWSPVQPCFTACWQELLGACRQLLVAADPAWVLELMLPTRAGLLEVAEMLPARYMHKEDNQRSPPLPLLIPPCAEPDFQQRAGGRDADVRPGCGGGEADGRGPGHGERPAIPGGGGGVGSGFEGGGDSANSG